MTVTLIIKLFLFIAVYIALFTVNLIIYLIDRLFLLNDKFIKIRIYTLSVSSTVILKILRIKVNVEKINIYDKNSFIISNHLSYIDILIISSIYKSSFIGSIDQVKNNKFFGYLALISGCVFVNRKERINIQNEIKEISNKLKRTSICFFPEATTSNGSKVLPFKSSFFQCIKNSPNYLKILTINYQKINGKKVSFENRDLIFYYGNHMFFNHFINLLKQNTIEVLITEKLEKNTNLHRKTLSQNTYNQISSNYIPII